MIAASFLSCRVFARLNKSASSFAIQPGQASPAMDFAGWCWEISMGGAAPACRVWWQAHRCSGGAKRVGMSFDLYRSKFTTSLCHAYFVRWNSYTFFDEVASPDRVMKYRDSTYRPPLPHLIFFAADTGAAAKDTETSLHPGCHTYVSDTVLFLTW